MCGHEIFDNSKRIWMCTVKHQLQINRVLSMRPFWLCSPVWHGEWHCSIGFEHSTNTVLQMPPATVAKAWSTSTQIVGYCLLFGSLLKCFIVLLVCVWIWWTHMVCTWRSEDNLWKFVLSLIPPCGFQEWILIRLDCRCLPTELSWWLKCLQL